MDGLKVAVGEISSELGNARLLLRSRFFPSILGKIAAIVLHRQTNEILAADSKKLKR